MKNQIERARLLKELHIKGDPLILFNIWDAGSAQAMQEIGAKAIAIRRVHAYAKVGADGFFVPGLKNADYIQQLCRESPIPINIMILPDMLSTKELAALGVARISYGPGPYCLVMNALKEAGLQAI